MTGPLTGPISLPRPDEPPLVPSVERGIWGAPYVWVTVGSVALIFLAAIQSLAVTTVMPIVSADLDGGSLYALAFAGTLATSVIGMVITGTWSDRSGPVRPLYAAVTLFVAGLVIAGAAPTMDVLVIGRLVQGLGVGGQTVALYVVVARVYPAVLHGRVFAVFSAAWVVPSLIGPFLAGAVAQYTHWRWVFIGVAVLTIIAFVLVAAKLRGIAMDVEGKPATERFWLRLLLAILLAASAVGLSLAGRTEPPWMWIVVAAAVVTIAFAIRPVTPRGTLRAAAGLPSVVLTRGVIAGAFFGAEVYIPYLLQQEYGFTATFSGLALTASAVAWATGAELQGRFGDRLGNGRIAGISTSLLVAAIVLAVLTAAFHLHPALLIAGWLFAGGAMGLLYPRLTVLTLAYSTPANQGFNSSALSISDALGSSMTIAVMGLVFVGLGSGQWAFTVVFAVAGLLALFTLVPGLRLGHAHEAQRLS